MNCPDCGEHTLVVATSHTKTGFTSRRRVCKGPEHHHFTTVEVLVTPGVVSKAVRTGQSFRGGHQIGVVQIPAATWLDVLNNKESDNDDRPAS